MTTSLATKEIRAATIAKPRKTELLMTLRRIHGYRLWYIS